MGWRYQAKRVKSDFGDGYEYTVVEALRIKEKQNGMEG